MATGVIDYGNGEVKVTASPNTMMIYEQEFNADILQDLYKKVVIRKEDTDEDIIAAIDFRNVNWTSLMKSLWACIKAADANTPGFKAWSENVGDIDMMAVNEKLMPIIEQGFFRSGADDAE